jgi:hypothetical protein
MPAAAAYYADGARSDEPAGRARRQKNGQVGKDLPVIKLMLAA